MGGSVGGGAAGNDGASYGGLVPGREHMSHVKHSFCDGAPMQAFVWW